MSGERVLGTLSRIINHIPPHRLVADQKTAALNDATLYLGRLRIV